ncbi:MAG: type IX secretion system membrane protein PorP/SprF [Cytophagales bacterium]|nr:type IX secretion system membrane protein PorP/SprF [Cytophagales bacterium]
MRYLLFVSVFLMSVVGWSQHFFSQLRNPAHLSIQEDLLLQVGYGSQWTKVPQSYKSYYLTGEYYHQQSHSLFGASVINQQVANQFVTNRIHAHYGYRLAFNDVWKGQLVASVGVLQNSASYDDLIFEDQINSVTGEVGVRQENLSEDINRTFFDGNTGLYIFSKRLEVGLHLKNFTQSSTYFPLVWGGELKYNFLMETKKGKQIAKSRISPFLLYQNQQNFSQLWTLGVEGAYENVFIQCAYLSQSWTSSTNVACKLGLSQHHFRFVYHLGINLINDLGGNSHQISIAYYL